MYNEGVNIKAIDKFLYELLEESIHDEFSVKI